jgi:CP family cyanate transporter-like MFS transporter
MSAWRSVVVGALLLLIGVNLRSVILAVPPILPLIRQNLGLSYTATGLLTSLPTLIMGAAAWSSGLLVERIGARVAVTTGLALLATGALLRAAFPLAVPIFLFTILMSLGIAMSQTTAAVLIRRWFPAHIGLLSAIFTDGLIIGETIGAGLTVPLMLMLFGPDGWRASFLLWGLPVVVLLAFWLWLAPAEPRQPAIPIQSTMPVSSAEIEVEQHEKKILPAKTPVRTVHLGLLLGSGSLIYFGMNAWIANYNQALHIASMTPYALTLLNAAQLPSSLGVTFFAQRMTGHRWPFIAAGFVCMCSILFWIFGPTSLEPLWAALLGTSSALVFTLGLALPALLAAPTKVARLAGATLSIGYSMAFIGPFIGGGLWDLFNVPALAFAPVLAASVVLAVAGVMLPASYSRGA